MSHTTTLQGIKMVDAKAIRQSVEDLIAEGINIVLKENAVPRMYYEHQARDVGKCEFVLSLPKARYDVGLKLNKDTGEYEAIFDEFMGSVAGQIGATCTWTPEMNKGEHAIGRFSQRYGVNAFKNEAKKHGMSVTEKCLPSGEIVLEADAETNMLTY
jgi:hypothetical protein